jgi:hypothetical protein
MMTPLDFGQLADESTLVLITVHKNHQPGDVLIDLAVLLGQSRVETRQLVSEPGIRLALRDSRPGDRVLTRIERRGSHGHPYLVGVRPGDTDLLAAEQVD